MKNKNYLKNHISNYWIIYLISALLSFVLWSTMIMIYTKDKKEDIVSIWLMSFNANIKEINNKLEEDKPDYLKHVRLTFVDHENDLVVSTYNTRGINYDIAILPESFLDKILIERTYASLDENYLNNEFQNLDYYQIDNVKYGIKIFDKDEEDNGLINYTKEGFEKENYYVFLNKKSIHMGEINQSRYSGGISVLKTLLYKI